MKRLLWLVVLAAGCDAPTRGEVVNDFDDHTVVYRVWFQTTLFFEPLAPGETSRQERLVPTTDFAYALLAPGWDITSGAPPTRLIPVRTAKELEVDRSGVLQLVLSSSTVLGECGKSAPLSAADAELITRRLFPGPFSNLSYDPKTCVSTPVAADGGP